MEVLPGDPATTILGPNATPERVEALREQLGLERPVVARYGDWLFGLVRGDLGDAATTSRGVWEIIATPLRNSVIFAAAALVAQLAARLVVLRHGRIVEQGPLVSVARQPASAYAAALLAAWPDPRRWATAGGSGAGPAIRTGEPDKAPDSPGSQTLPDGPDRVEQTAPTEGPAALSVHGLSASYATGKGRFAAAARVGFEVRRGECVALVGPSGAGKTTIARSLIGVHPPDDGVVRLAGSAVAARAADRPLDERRRVQLIAQDLWTTQNPRRRVGAALTRSVELYRRCRRDDAQVVARGLFERVGLHADLLDRRPGELSGGELQRVNIAIALAAEPEVLVCDESTSALDVTVQAEMLDLLDELRRELELSVLFITHDLGVVARIADRVLILDGGLICEQGTTAEVFGDPRHETTKRLIEASPSLTGTIEARAVAVGAG